MFRNDSYDTLKRATENTQDRQRKEKEEGCHIPATEKPSTDCSRHEGILCNLCNLMYVTES